VRSGVVRRLRLNGSSGPAGGRAGDNRAMARGMIQQDAGPWLAAYPGGEMGCGM